MCWYDHNLCDEKYKIKRIGKIIQVKISLFFQNNNIISNTFADHAVNHKVRRIREFRRNMINKLKQTSTRLTFEY